MRGEEDRISEKISDKIQLVAFHDGWNAWPKVSSLPGLIQWSNVCEPGSRPQPALLDVHGKFLICTGCPPMHMLALSSARRRLLPFVHALVRTRRPVDHIKQPVVEVCAWEVVEVCAWDSCGLACARAPTSAPQR